MINSQPKQISKQDFHSKSQYKVHKRKTRNQLIFLVGLHVFLIFLFCALITSEYLLQSKNQQLMAILSDTLYIIYFILVLFAVKYKLKYLMMMSIVTLVVCVGLKIQLCVINTLNNHKLNIFYTMDVVFVLLNCIVPWGFLILWNKLKQSKWKETFDLRFKLNNYLLEDQNQPVK